VQKLDLEYSSPSNQAFGLGLGYPKMESMFKSVHCLFQRSAPAERVFGHSGILM